MPRPRKNPRVDLDAPLPDEDAPIRMDEVVALKAAKRKPKVANRKIFGVDAVDDEALHDLLQSRVIDEPPHATFSHRAVQRMAQIGVPDADIARIIGIDVELLTTEAADALRLGRDLGRVELRARQYAAAMQGDKNLLVWLGKQTLGQADKVSQEVSGPGGSPIEHRHAIVSVRAKLEAMLNGSMEPIETLDAPTEVLSLPPAIPDQADAADEATD